MIEFVAVYRSADHLSTRRQIFVRADIDVAMYAALDECDDTEFLAAVVQQDQASDVRLDLARLLASESEYHAEVMRDPDTVWWARAYRNGAYMTGFGGETREVALGKAQHWAELDRAARAETPEPDRVAL